jgi:hypothetical protein
MNRNRPMRRDRPERLPIGVEVVVAHMGGDPLLRDSLLAGMFPFERMNLAETLAGLSRTLTQYCAGCGAPMEEDEGILTISSDHMQVRRHEQCKVGWGQVAA